MRQINVNKIKQFDPYTDSVKWLNSQPDKTPLALLNAAKTIKEMKYVLLGITSSLNDENSINLRIFSLCEFTHPVGSCYETFRSVVQHGIDLLLTQE